MVYYGEGIDVYLLVVGVWGFAVWIFLDGGKVRMTKLSGFWEFISTARVGATPDLANIISGYKAREHRLSLCVHTCLMERTMPYARLLKAKD